MNIKLILLDGDLFLIYYEIKMIYWIEIVDNGLN